MQSLHFFWGCCLPAPHMRTVFMPNGVVPLRPCSPALASSDFMGICNSIATPTACAASSPEAAATWPRRKDSSKGVDTETDQFLSYFREFERLGACFGNGCLQQLPAFGTSSRAMLLSSTQVAHPKRVVDLNRTQLAHAQSQAPANANTTSRSRNLLCF